MIAKDKKNGSVFHSVSKSSPRSIRFVNTNKQATAMLILIQSSRLGLAIKP